MDRTWWTLTAVSTGVFMLLLDLTIVNVALPVIQTSFHASLSDLQWVIDAYALTLAAFLMTSGSLADLFGRRRPTLRWSPPDRPQTLLTEGEAIDD